MIPKISALAASFRDVATIETDLLVIPLFEEHDTAEMAALDAMTDGEVRRALVRGEFAGKPHEIFLTRIVSRSKAKRLALVGAGTWDHYSVDRARRLALTVCVAARQRRFSRVAMLQPRGRMPRDEGSWIEATAEGVVLASFDAAPYKSDLRQDALCEVLLLTTPSNARERAVKDGECLGECTNLARELTNEPANRMTPAALAQRAEEIGAVPGLHVDILDQERIEALGMRLLLGVAAGSQQPPRLIVMEYTPAGGRAGPVLGLVGKGVTFDAGGLNLSRAEDLENMKEDMAGGAAVICAMRAIALLNAPVHVIGIVPAAENMPGPGALKPGDVLRAANGTTVEIRDTDAEGRLLLADALWYARERGATHLVDIATLTNACVTALGEFTSGLFGTPANWLETVRRCADLAGERCWPLPMFDEYRERLRSDIADIANSGGRPAAAITAALFLRAFSSGLPWAHIDVAGTAWSYETRDGQPKGPTGVGVRTLAAVALSRAKWTDGASVEASAAVQHC